MNEEPIIDYNFLKKTWNLKTELPINSALTYSTNIFDTFNKDLSSHLVHDRLILLVDKKVYKLYKKEMKNYFNSNKIEYKILEVDIGEGSKNWNTVEKVLHFFESISVFRQEEIIIIGGGVLLDIGGFACSIYRRGIPYVKVPTTLLAIVDASVGAKVGINHFGRRNRLGSYYPPVKTLIDKSFVSTQEEKEIVNGLGEIFKIAIIKSTELFNLLDSSFESLINEKFQYGAVPVRVINLSISLMLEELAPNLWEKNLKRAVDFGHTFSPVIELKNIPNLLHGEAVALDCIFSSCLSFNRGYINKEILSNIINVARKLKLNTYHKDFTNYSLLKESMDDAYKHRNGNQYITLPIGIGDYKIFNDIEYNELKDAIRLFKEIN